MTQTIDSQAAETHPGTDLVAELLRVLAESSEPLTLSKIRAKLPAPFRSASLEELSDTLQRQVAANVLFQYPKYRSQQDRFWNRPMEVHLAILIPRSIPGGAVGVGGAAPQASRLCGRSVDPCRGSVGGTLGGGRCTSIRASASVAATALGCSQPMPKSILKPELAELFLDLEQLGFSQGQLRTAALELLHDEEWSPAASAESHRPLLRRRTPLAEGQPKIRSEKNASARAQPHVAHETAQAH